MIPLAMQHQFWKASALSVCVCGHHEPQRPVCLQNGGWFQHVVQAARAWREILCEATICLPCCKEIYTCWMRSSLPFFGQS